MVRRTVRRSLNAQHNAIFEPHLEAMASQVGEHVFIERGGWEAEGKGEPTGPRETPIRPLE